MLFVCRLLPGAQQLHSRIHRRAHANGAQRAAQREDQFVQVRGTVHEVHLRKFFQVSILQRDPDGRVSVADVSIA